MSAAAATVGSRPLPVRASTTATLAVALVAATGWAVLGGGWNEATGAAVLIGVLGAMEAMALVRLGAPRALALAAAPLLLFATLLPLTAASRPATGSGVWALVAQYATAAATGLLGNSAWEFNVALAALLWLCGAWAAWFAIRERRGALASGPCWAVLAVNVVNAPTGGDVGVPAVIAAVAGIMLIAAVHLDRLSDGWQRRRVGVLPGTDGRYAAAAAAGAALIVVVALLFPPLTSTDISARLFGFGGHARGGGAGGHSFAVGTVQFNPSTIPGGALVLGNQSVLSYRSDTAAPTYLSMAVDTVFAAGDWLPDPTDSADIADQAMPPGAIDRDRNVADGGVGADQRSVTASIQVSAEGAGADVIPFPGEPDAVSLPADVVGLVPPGTFSGFITVDTVTAMRSLVGTSFSSTATYSTATVAQLRQAGTAYPAYITQDGFLSLEDDATGGAGVIGRLAQQWTAGTTNAYDAATAIENHLRSPKNFHYTLTPPLPEVGAGRDIWPVVYFLTVSHAGYCQYYASAMGAMLRSLGIPARLVNGYGPGTSVESTVGRNSSVIHAVTSNDAHTWVQAFFPGYGWISFEPTPQSLLGDYEPFPRGGAIPVPTTAAPASSAPSAAPSPTPTPTRSAAAAPPGPDVTGGSTVPSALAGGTLGVIGLLILAIAAMVWFARPRGMRGVWRRVTLVGRVLGIRREPSMTFDDYARRLAAAVPPDTTSLRHRGGGDMPRGVPLRRRVADALADIAMVSDRATYGPTAAHPREVVQMRRAWGRIARVTPRLGWRALLNRSATP